MTVRRLKAKQRGPWCSYCEDKTRAVHRGLGFRKFACSAHLDKLTTEDKAIAALGKHQTEAEWQLGV